MASINKLSVRGVRSFSPEDAEQVLEFYMPLTVIVGANGCGKTTIIESLKFAVCGSLPPGKTAGQAFVHDPRSIGSSVVKANVKLRYNNAAGNSMVVVRSMEVKQAKTKLNFKQLDGTIRATDQHGQRVSMSHKCSDLDRQIPLLLGVSKAILENVVFCHQEDASWPLQEGAVLKKKFDDIFDSTRYTKALEVFAKAKKEYTLKAKDHKAVVAELRSHRHAAQGFRSEIQKHQDQLEDLEDQLESSRHAIAENKEEQTSLEGKLNEIIEIEEELEAENLEEVMVRGNVYTIKRMIQEDLTEKFSRKELEEQLRAFDHETKFHEDRQRELEEQHERFKHDLETIRREQKDLESEVGRVQAGKEADAQNRAKRYNQMCAIGKTFGLEDMITQTNNTQENTYSQTSNESGDIPETILDISPKDMDEYFRVVRKKREELEEQLSSLKHRNQEQEDSFNNELSDLKGKLSSIEFRTKESRSEQLKLRDEMAKIRAIQKENKVLKSNFEDVKKNAMEAARARDKVNDDPRQKNIPIEIGSLNHKIESLKKKIENDRAAQEDLRSTLKTQNAIEEMKAKCERDLDDLATNIKDESWSLQTYKIDLPTADLPKLESDPRGQELQRIMEGVRDKINEKLEDKERELEKEQDATRRMDAIVAEKSALRNHDIQSIHQKQNRLSMLKPSIEKTRTVVDELVAFEKNDPEANTPLDITADHPEELLSYLRDRLEYFESNSIEGIPPDVVTKVLKKLFRMGMDTTEDPYCPCCKRVFNGDNEITTFQRTMSKLRKKDSKLLEVDEETKIARPKYEEWISVIKGTVGDVLEYNRLEKELDDLQRNVDELTSALNARKTERDGIKEQVEGLMSEIKEVRNLCDLSKRWVGDSSRIALERDQVKQRETSFQWINTDGEGRDLKQVEADLSDSIQKQSEFTEKVTKLNMDLASINKRAQEVSNMARNLEENLKRMEKKYEAQLKAEERNREIQKQLEEKAEEIEKFSGQMAPLKQRIETKEKQRTRARNLGAEEEERVATTLTSFNRDVTALQHIIDMIKEYEDSKAEDLFERLASKKKALANKAKEKDDEIEKLMPDLHRLQRIVGDQEQQRKNIEENIKLSESTEKMKEIAKRKRKVEEELRGLEHREDLENDKKSLEQRNEQLIASKARLEGRRGEIIDAVRSLKRKLSQNEYKDVEEDFRRASIRQDTTEMAVKDIEKYHCALDKALQRYHSIKIMEINTIIRDLWNLTYKGEDITSIEIVSGNESGSRSSRSYNYRVVMSKGGGSQMDMRGRCSAGQRVLASIVIRLALAETFCVKFGCISLDEPTVNLDYNNKRGLAIALAQIIASRSQQSNFQLVLITHDEDFVLMLKNELSTQSNVSMPEKYFQIRREEGVDGKYYSKIDAIDWEELL